MLRAPHYTLAAAVIALAVAGCRDASAPDDVTRSRSVKPTMSEATVAPLVLHIIAPQLTDANIDYVPTLNPQLNHHYVWLDTSARGNPKLLVFMAGANGRPVGWQLVQQEAARVGYHVIGLMYQNNVPVDSICKGSSDRDCSGNLRLEILEGVDSSSLTVVTPANSIDNRLAKLLPYLASQYPDEGWSRFLEEDGTPKWSQIAVAGHSQGGGQAALIGRLRHVDRVVMFSSPPDARVPDEVDPWVFIGATPAAKYFALFHDRDQLAAAIRANLAALNMEGFGAAVQAELSAPPYDGTHILFTDLMPQGGYATPRPHQSTTRDDRTPLGPDGTPLLRDAWRYLLGEPSQDDEEN
jgi:hypothetical protein